MYITDIRNNMSQILYLVLLLDFVDRNGANLIVIIENFMHAFSDGIRKHYVL